MQTQNKCDEIKTLERNIGVFKTRFIRIDRDVVEFPDKAIGEYSVVHQGNNKGAVAIPFTDFRGIGYIGLTRQYRYPLGAEKIEFPRGGTSDLSPEEAQREVVEEMGYVPTRMLHLGNLNPDSGILPTTIGAWVAFTTSETLPTEHLEVETGLRSVWVSEGVFEGMVRRGEITCGITLAAYALFRIKRQEFGTVGYYR